MSDGGGGQQQSTTTQTIPPWLQDSARSFLDAAGQVSQLPYTPYTGQRVADLSPVQHDAIQGITDLNSAPYMGAAGGMLTNTLNGQYQNPFGSGNAVGSGGQYQFNPVSGGSNPYEGENPYFQQMRGGALDDVVHNYQTAVAPEITRMMNLSGNLGGSAHLNAMSNAQRELAQQLGRVSAGMSSDEYNRSAQLAEGGLNRGLQAGQFNANLGNQAFESAAQRGLNAGEFNANLGSQAYENERNRQMGAVSGASSLFGAQQQGLTNQLNAGDIERRQNQSLLDSNYGDFLDWRNYPDQRLGIFGNALGSIFGGAPRNTTTSTDLPGTDRVAQGMGIMSLANAFGGKGSSKP